MVLEETVPVPDSVGIDEQKEEGNLSSIRKVSPPPPACLYQPPILYPQRLAWAELS